MHAATLQDAARELYNIDVKLQQVHRDLVDAPTPRDEDLD